MSWNRRKSRGVELLTAARLTRFPWLRHGFTLRRPGTFNLNYSLAKSLQRVARNRRALLRALRSAEEARPWQLVTLQQRHTDIIQSLGRVPTAKRRERDGAVKLVGDALVTNQPGLLLAVQVADCLPIVLVDPQRRVVAVVHTGWRGTLKRITEKTVGRMQQEFGCQPKKILAVIGPGIRRCCYEVGREVADAFVGQFSDWEKLVTRTGPSPTRVHWQQPLFSSAPGTPRPRPAVTAPAAERFHLDLVEANRCQLRAAGLSTGNIIASPLCTACRTDLFFSHRAERGCTGRMMGVVGLVAPHQK